MFPPETKITSCARRCARTSSIVRRKSATCERTPRPASSSSKRATTSGLSPEAVGTRQIRGSGLSHEGEDVVAQGRRVAEQLAAAGDDPHGASFNGTSKTSSTVPGSMGTPRSFLRLACALALLALVLATPAMSASRMWIGFQDDPNLRWNDHRPSAARADGRRARDDAPHLGVLAVHRAAAAHRPDRLGRPRLPLPGPRRVRPAGADPRAGGADHPLGHARLGERRQGPERLPTNIGAFQQFAFAVAHRYNGRTPGFPYVRFYSIWNEPNLGQFLSPQFSGKKDVGPQLYAKLYRAGYAGVKAGSPQAFVGVGRDLAARPRQARERDPGLELARPLRPARRAAEAGDQVRRVGPPPVRAARRRRRLRRPSYPNVTLSNLGLFETNLRTYFKRKSVPIWITEYAHETRPDEPKGVTYAQQASYAKIALTAAAKIPDVQMFVWFVLRDDPTSTWQSGFIRANGALKPGFSTFSKTAAGLDARNAVFNVAPGKRVGQLRFGVRELAVHMTSTERVGISYQVFDKGKLVVAGGPDSALGVDDWVGFTPVLTPVHKHTYVIKIVAGNIHGDFANRTLTLITR